MKESSLVKKQAREFLQGNWGALIIAFFALCVPYTIFQCVDTLIIFLGDYTSIGNAMNSIDPLSIKFLLVVAILLIEIVAVVLFLPLLSGITKLSYAVANGEKGSCGDIVYFISRERYFSAVFFNIVMLVKRLFWTFIAFLPTILCFVGVSVIDRLAPQLNIFSIILVALEIIFGIGGLIVAVVLNSKYFLAEYLYVISDGEESTTAIVKKSISIMKNNRDKYLKLVLSFVPWMLLCFFVLPLFYVYPYMQAAFANSAKWILKLAEKEEVAAVQMPFANFENSNGMYSGV